MEAIDRALQPFARRPLLTGPTPIERLTGLERALGDAAGGARIHVKRDDVMGIGGGGNKLRKLEFLLGDALAAGCDTFITTGGLQSNHARLTAAATARAGLRCELMLADIVPIDDQDYRANGNLLLDDLFGATVHRLPPGADPMAAARARADELAGRGRKAYVVGAGGSSPVGCLGYVSCAGEILEHERASGAAFALIACANGSAGTHAGLAAGFAFAGQAASRTLSFAVLAERDAAHAATLALANATLQRMGAPGGLVASDIGIDGSQRGEAYGIPTPAMRDAVRLMARSEGLLLDPVYSGKAFAGLLALVRDGRYRDRDVLFVMTGGTPGLFAYRSTLATA